MKEAPIDQSENGGQRCSKLGRLPKWRNSVVHFIEHLQREQTILTILMGACSGYLAWHTSGHWLVMVSVIPLMVWGLARTRLRAGLVMAAYLCVSGITAPQVIAHYMQWPQTLGILLHVLYSAIYGLFWGVLSAPKGSLIRRYAHMLLGIVVLSIPPLGVVFYGNPMFGSGALYPGLGIVGLVFTTGLIVAVWSTRQAGASHLGWLFLVGMLFLSVVANAMQLRQHAEPSSNIAKVKVMNMNVGSYPHGVEQRYRFHLSLVSEIESWILSGDESQILLLPEAIAGRLEPRFAWLWDEVAVTAAHRNKTVAFGLLDGGSTEIRNTLTLVGAHNATLMATATVPIGMWNPLRTHGHAPQRWFEPPDQIEILGNTTGALLCWEELLLWSWLRHAQHNTTMMLIGANSWFDPSNSVDRAQQISTWSMSRLLGITAYRAANKS